MYENIIKDWENYIFFAKKSFPQWSKHIWRKQAWKLITKRCNDIWLQWRYWWHTLRKTRWYHARMKGITLPIIQHKLNHSNIWMTLKYLWITADEIEDACNNLDL
jgi:site-specific recombinase XerD